MLLQSGEDPVDFAAHVAVLALVYCRQGGVDVVDDAHVPSLEGGYRVSSFLLFAGLGEVDDVVEGIGYLGAGGNHHYGLL